MSAKLDAATVKMITNIAARTATDSITTRLESWKREERKRLHNSVKNSLSAYRAIKKQLDDELHLTNDEKTEMRWDFLNDIVETKPHTNVDSPEKYIIAAERKRKENLFFIAEIETALRVYEETAKQSKREERTRRYRILCARYIDKRELSVIQIADREHIAEKTVYQDLNIAIGTMAVILYGFEAVRAGLSIDKS